MRGVRTLHWSTVDLDTEGASEVSTGVWFPDGMRRSGLDAARVEYSVRRDVWLTLGEGGYGKDIKIVVEPKAILTEGAFDAEKWEEISPVVGEVVVGVEELIGRRIELDKAVDDADAWYYVESESDLLDCPDIEDLLVAYNARALEVAASKAQAEEYGVNRFMFGVQRHKGLSAIEVAHMTKPIAPFVVQNHRSRNYLMGLSHDPERAGMKAALRTPILASGNLCYRAAGTGSMAVD